MLNSKEQELIAGDYLDEVLSIDTSSITLSDCIARGWIHNTSDSLYARNVVATLWSPDGSKNVIWRWPLTMQPGERAPFEVRISWPIVDITDPTGYINFDVAADMSEEPDISRSFVVNYDGTPRYYGNNNYEVFYMAYDERLYAVQDRVNVWEASPRPARFYINEELFHDLYPKYLVKSNDVDSVASEWGGLDFSDVYYIPGDLHPELVESEGTHDVDDVRVFQAIIHLNEVKDVRELVPFVVETEKDQDRILVRRSIVPINKISSTASDHSARFFVLDTVPRVISGYSQDYALNWGQNVWIGSGKGIDPFEGAKSTAASLNSQEQRGLLPAPCDSPAGGLTWRDLYFEAMLQHETNVSMGYHGIFTAFQSSRSAVGKLVVDPDSITVGDGIIRGRLLNSASDLSAQAVLVQATSSDGPNYHDRFQFSDASWYRLSIGPGQHRSFEITGWTGSSNPEDIEFKVFAVYWQPQISSETVLPYDFVDPTLEAVNEVAIDTETVSVKGNVVRGLAHNLSDKLFARDVVVTVVSEDNDTDLKWQWPLTVQPGERIPFEISGWNGSSNPSDVEFEVSASFAERVDISRAFQIFENKVGLVYPESMEEQRKQETFDPPQIPMRNSYNLLHYSEEEFYSHYPELLVERSDIDSSGFFFYDYHAELERTYSHPNLNSAILDQTIEDLRAYVAFMDSDMEVVAVKELAPFTAIYQSAGEIPNLALVDRVPTQSSQSRRSVRLLLTIPRQSKDQNNPYQFFQIWIGDALEPLP